METRDRRVVVLIEAVLLGMLIFLSILLVALVIVTELYGQEVNIVPGILPCGWELPRIWNRFANDANAYVTGLKDGIVDAKLRKKVESEFQAVTRSECW